MAVYQVSADAPYGGDRWHFLHTEENIELFRILKYNLTFADFVFRDAQLYKTMLLQVMPL